MSSKTDSTKNYIHKVLFFDKEPKQLIKIISESKKICKNIINILYPKKLSIQFLIQKEENEKVIRINNNNNKNNDNKFYKNNYKIFEAISLLTLEYEYTKNGTSEKIDPKSYKMNTPYTNMKKTIFNIIDKKIDKSNDTSKEIANKLKDEINRLDTVLNEYKDHILTKFKENHKAKSVINELTNKSFNEKIKQLTITNVKRINGNNLILDNSTINKITGLINIENSNQQKLNKNLINKIKIRPQYYLILTIEKSKYTGFKTIQNVKEQNVREQNGGDPTTLILTIIVIILIILCIISGSSLQCMFGYIVGRSL